MNPQSSPYSIFHGASIFLTGVTGFKGSWLAEWLLSLGAEVHGYALAPDTEPALFNSLDLRSRIRFTEGDVRQPEVLARALQAASPDFVFHLAAQPLVRRSYIEPLSTYETNVIGTIHLLEALREFNRPCAAVFITTDKVYENREWLHGYREEDSLGGYDPYSSSKAACEIAIASWRRSFFHAHPVRIASARAGNVIGGGDWAQDRIVPDSIRSLRQGASIPIRNKTSTRPWQHVLEPLSGYLALAVALAAEQIPGPHSGDFSSSSSASFNFGPNLDSNRTVLQLVEEILRHWPGMWEDCSDPNAPHEAGKLNLATDKAFHLLGWQPRWDFATTIQKTVEWYRGVHEGTDPREITAAQILNYSQGVR